MAGPKSVIHANTAGEDAPFAYLVFFVVDEIRMSMLNLKPWQRRQLRQQLKAAGDVRTYQRTLALLELDRGRSATDVANMLGVTRQSVHNWAIAFAREPEPTLLFGNSRRGRPAVLTEQTVSCLPLLMRQSPQNLGYSRTDWTVPLLQQELQKGWGFRPSDETVRRGLRQLGFVWKRPRYVLKSDLGGI